jgi:hypothetical protein
MRERKLGSEKAASDFGCVFAGAMVTPEPPLSADLHA